MKVEESLSVTFDETPPPPKTSPLEDDELVEEEAIEVSKTKPIGNDLEDIIDFKLYQMDMKSAFLNGVSIEELRAQPCRLHENPKLCSPRSLSVVFYTLMHYALGLWYPNPNGSGIENNSLCGDERDHAEDKFL
ncbi:hypothetical protein Tco_1185521 [Tanacetum coccineum]